MAITKSPNLIPQSSSTETTAEMEPPIELANCLPQADPVTKFEEDFARKEAAKANLSKEELLARIIFSEALSTGFWRERCSAHSEEDILKAIGWGILNRVKRRESREQEDFSSVIFSRGQFRTSFSSKRKNPFAVAFLCPLKAKGYLEESARPSDPLELYGQARSVSNKILDIFSKTGIPEEHNGITNFFYPYSEFFGDLRPKWAPNKVGRNNKGYVNVLNVKDRPCVESYRIK